MKDKSVLVTGATGFIGQALIAQLRSAGLPVKGAARSKPRPGQFGRGFECVAVGGLGSGTDWAAAVENVAAVVHLAGRAHVMRDGGGDLICAYRQVNAYATERLARQAAEAGVRRLIFVSSALVNGSHSTDLPFSEADSPAAGGPYARSKLEAEHALRLVAADTGMELVIVRPPLVYGPCARGNFLRLMRVVDRGIPLPIASIRNRRSFVGLSNLCGLLRLCIDHPAAAGETFLAADETLSTPMLVRRIADALGRPVRLWPCPTSLLELAGRLTGRSSTVARLTESLEVDSGKVRRMLGWSPATSMAEELASTAAWWRGREQE